MPIGNSNPTLSPPKGASVWEAEMFGHLVDHIEHEGHLLEEYQEAATSTESEALAYVIGLVIEDERRHHQLFRSLAQTLKQEAELTSGTPEIPYLDFGRADALQVRDITKRLLRSEENDAQELKRLHNELHDFRDTTLWDLLVTIMRRDTDKHIAMLEFAPPAHPHQEVIRWFTGGAHPSRPDNLVGQPRLTRRPVMESAAIDTQWPCSPGTQGCRSNRRADSE